MSDKEKADKWYTTGLKNPVFVRRIIGCTMLLMIAVIGYQAGTLYLDGKKFEGNTLSLSDLQEGVTMEEVLVAVPAVIDQSVEQATTTVEEVFYDTPKADVAPTVAEKKEARCLVMADKITEELLEFALTNGCTTKVVSYLEYPHVCDSIRGRCHTI